MSQEELNESDKKQSFDEGSHSITKLDGHLKNDHANNDDAIANASDPEETFDKTRRENMDVEDQNSSAQSKATGIDRRRGTDEDTEDQNSMKKNSMRSDAAVKPMEGFEEQSDQPIQKSENQSKTPEWGEVDDIFKTITKELETSDVDNNKSNNNGDLIAKQESSVINDRRENVCKNIMDAQTDDILTNSPPSPATEGNDGSNKEGNEFLHGVDAEDQDLKGMTTLQNVRSGITTVEHKKRLEKKSEHIQKSENQPKTPEWGEILNGIFNENIDNLTIIQPSAATGGTGQSNKKTDEEDPPSNTAGLIDEENFGKKITKNGRDDVYKTSESSTAVASRSRSIFDPFPQKLFDDGCHSSDDKVPNAEAVETAVVESIMPESTQQLESSNDKENIQEQGQKEKVTKKLEEKQDTIEVKDDAKNVNPKEIAGQSKQANDSMDVIKELGSDGGQAEENDKKETSKEKNKEENINKVGKSQKDEGNDGCFPFLTKRKKRRKSKAKEKRDESDDRKERKEIKSQKKGKKSKAKEKKDESDDGKEWKEIKSEKKGKKSKAKEKKEESDDGKGSKGIESQKKGKKSKTKEKKDETDDGKKGKENKSEKKGKKSKANKKN